MTIVEKRDDGKIKLHQPSLTGAGAAGGALWGGLIGLIFFAPLLGMAFGAAAGAAAGAASDAGVDDKFMKQLGTELQAGGAALILLVRQAHMEKILSEVEGPAGGGAWFLLGGEAKREKTLAGVGGRGEVIKTSLNPETERAPRDALATAGAPAV